MNRVLKEYRKIGRGHSDDIACAAIRVEKAKEEGVAHEYVETASEDRA
jgi:hypothetical protein